MTVSGADSVRVRVHIYERKFRAKPVRVLVADVNGARTGVDIGAAPDGVMNTARFCRTNATSIWGVSDPSFQSAEPRQEGGRGGRSRPGSLGHSC